MIDFDYAVIGNGLFGSSAARHLSIVSDSVVVIGPDEPVDFKTHEGVFSSHYDQGRLTRRIAANRLWAEMTARTFTAMQMLEAATGLTIHRPVGSLTVTAPGVVPRHGRQRAADVPGDPIALTEYAAGDESWRRQFPEYEFPHRCTVTYEPPPSGMLDPRAMVSAQSQVARAQGAFAINDFVTEAIDNTDAVTVTMSSGRQLKCGRVLVAAGAFTNHFGLLPRPLRTTTETEVVMLGAVSEEDGQRLSALPTVHFSIDDPDIADVYMTPPLVYPDGTWKVKMGCNTAADTTPVTLDAIQSWFRTGDTDAVGSAMSAAMQAILPNVDFLEFETVPCIITMTDNDHPIIDRVSDRLFVVVAGNGMGAKSSDGWGGLAAQLLLDDPWPGWIDAGALAAR